MTRRGWRERVRWFPPLRLYRSVVVQGVALFYAVGVYIHHNHRLIWAIGGYLFGLVGMTALYLQERIVTTRALEACHAEERDTTDRLWDAVDQLWGTLSSEQVRELRAERPEVVDLAHEAHERMWHDHTP